MVTLLVCRFLASILGSAVFSNFGGTLSDLFTPDERGPWVALFTLVLQGAPTIGPVPGSFMGQYLNWRWVLALTTIWGGFITVFVLFLPETEPGKLQRTLAKRETVALPEEKSRIRDSELWSKALLTPLSEFFLSLSSRCFVHTDFMQQCFALSPSL